MAMGWSSSSASTPAQQMPLSGLSDRAPVGASFALQQSKKLAAPIIPKWLEDVPAFGATLALSRRASIRTNSLTPSKAGIHACLIREAGQHVRAVESTSDKISVLTKAMVSGSAAHAMARQQTRNMSALLASQTLLKDLFAVVGQQVVLLDGPKWEGPSTRSSMLLCSIIFQSLRSN